MKHCQPFENYVLSRTLRSKGKGEMIGPACGEPETRVLKFDMTTNWIAVYGTCNKSAGTFPRQRPCASHQFRNQKGKADRPRIGTKIYDSATNRIDIRAWKRAPILHLFRKTNWKMYIRCAFKLNSLQGVPHTRIPSSRTMACAACITPVYFETGGGFPLANRILVVVGSSCTCVAAHQTAVSRSLLQ
jgi:hypothetical protein